MLPILGDAPPYNTLDTPIHPFQRVIRSDNRCISHDVYWFIYTLNQGMTMAKIGKLRETNNIWLENGQWMKFWSCIYYLRVSEIAWIWKCWNINKLENKLNNINWQKIPKRRKQTSNEFLGFPNTQCMVYLPTFGLFLWFSCRLNIPVPLSGPGVLSQKPTQLVFQAKLILNWLHARSRPWRCQKLLSVCSW